MADFWDDLQVSVIAKITHSSVSSYRLRLQIGVNFLLLRPPPVFARNNHHTQFTVLSIGIGSELIEVSIADCWDNYYRPTDQIPPDIPPPYFARNNPQAQPTVKSTIHRSSKTITSSNDTNVSEISPFSSASNITN